MKKTITIDRNLFEKLVEIAIDLRGEWKWKQSCGHKPHEMDYHDLAATVEWAVIIRDNVEGVDE